MDEEAYFQQLADTAITRQELVKMAADGEGFQLPPDLLQQILAPTLGAIGGGALGYMTGGKSGDLEKRIRRLALLGALTGLGGYHGYKQLNARRAPGESLLTGVPDSIADRLRKVGLDLPREGDTPPAPEPTPPASTAPVDKSQTQSEMARKGLGPWLLRYLSGINDRPFARATTDAASTLAGQAVGGKLQSLYQRSSPTADLGTIHRGMTLPGDSGGTMGGIQVYPQGAKGPETLAKAMGVGDDPVRQARAAEVAQNTQSTIDSLPRPTIKDRLRSLVRREPQPRNMKNMPGGRVKSWFTQLPGVRRPYENAVAETFATVKDDMSAIDQGHGGAPRSTSAKNPLRTPQPTRGELSLLEEIARAKQKQAPRGASAPKAPAMPLTLAKNKHLATGQGVVRGRRASGAARGVVASDKPMTQRRGRMAGGALGLLVGETVGQKLLRDTSAPIDPWVTSAQSRLNLFGGGKDKQ